MRHLRLACGQSSRPPHLGENQKRASLQREQYGEHDTDYANIVDDQWFWIQCKRSPPQCATDRLLIKGALRFTQTDEIGSTMRRATAGFLFAMTFCPLDMGCAAAATVTPSTTLSIHIENVLPGGVIRLGIYDEARYPDNNSTPIASADTNAVQGETIITIHGVPPGVYAIQTFQDVNANGKMDTSWVGLPLEPFGFSQDAVPFLGKPSFDEVKFYLAAGDNVLTIHLQNSGRSTPADKARDAIHARQRQ